MGNREYGLRTAVVYVGNTTQILPPQVKTVSDTATIEQFRRHGTYHVAIRGKNCGSGAGSTTITFELK